MKPRVMATRRRTTQSRQMHGKDRRLIVGGAGSQLKAMPPHVPPLYLSKTSANGRQWPRTAMAHTSEILALFCEFAGQREATCTWRLGGGLPPAQAVSTTSSGR